MRLSKSVSRAARALVAATICAGAPNASSGSVESMQSAVVFAPETVSTGNVYRGSFAPAGDDLYFFKRIGEENENYRIFRSRRTGDGWDEPHVVDLGGAHSDLYPAVAPDGSFLVFSSYRAAPGDERPGRNANLWMARREDDGWGEPTLLPVSTPANYDVKPLITADGLLLFETTTPDWSTTRSMVARWNRETFVDARPWEPVERWRSWRSDLHVWGGIPSPDGRLVLLEISPVTAGGRPGPPEHWVTFRIPGSWSEPVPVPAMNAGGGGNFAFWGPMGREIFFVRDLARFLRIDATEGLAELRPPAARIGRSEVTSLRFAAADGVELYGELYRSHHDDAPVVLLFHQGAGSSAEYARIAPRLARSGYHVVTVDLRRGGDLFGPPNRTVAGLGGATPASYCDVFPDLEATLAAARAHGLGGPLVAWGSSYSAALVLRLALEHPDEIAAVAAFSPASGEPMAGCEPEPLAARLRQPLFVARPDRELTNAELPWIAEQFQHFAAHGATTFVSAGGRHASSMLVAERNAGSTGPAWQALGEFLFGAVPAPGLRVTLDNDGWRLVGDLTLPLTDGPYPAALLLHNAAGSRHEQAGLAAELAQRGIASLRLDLRGHGESVNRGRFDPDDPEGTRYLIREAGNDVRYALETLPSLAAIDPRRIAVVGASYSGEAMAEAARSMGRYQAAYVALSPGNFSESSIAAIDHSGASWLMVRSEIERPFFDELFADIAAGSAAEIEVVPGDRHGTDILASADPANRVADWIAARLSAQR